MEFVLTAARISAIMISLVFLISIIRLVIKKKLNEGDSIIWLLFSILIFLFAIFDDLLHFVIRITGTKDLAIMLLFFSLLFTLILVLKNSITVSKQKEQVKNLTQELALMKGEIEKSKRR
jgi:hypothetical protein